MYFCSQVTAVIKKMRKVPNVTLIVSFMKFQNMLTFLVLKFFAKKAISEHQFLENGVACGCSPLKTIGKLTLVAII